MPSRSAAVGGYAVRDSYVITFWIIGLVVLGTLFWLSVLAIALLLCYKRRYREDAAYGYATGYDNIDSRPPEIVAAKSYPINETITHHTTTYVENGTVKVTSDEPYPPQQEKVQTHGMVILDEDSPHQSPEPKHKEYETRSASLKFNEELPEWESMDIQLRIDPSGKHEPVITRREHESGKDTGKHQ